MLFHHRPDSMLVLEINSIVGFVANYLCLVLVYLGKFLYYKTLTGWPWENLLKKKNYSHIQITVILLDGIPTLGQLIMPALTLAINLIFFLFSSVHFFSHVQLFATPWIAARQVSLSITNSRSSPSLTPIKSVMPSSHLILCCPLLLLPPIPPSITVFSNESTLRMRWPKYWSFSFSIIPSKEIPGLISFRMDWLDLLAVQGTLKSLL